MRDIVHDAAPVDVDDRSLARTAEPLDLVFLHLRPDVDGRLLATDGILVPRSRRAFVSDLVRSRDAIGQLRWISFPTPAPRLQNMEGEPILLVTASYRVADPAAAGRALARTLREDEDGVFTESVVRRGRDWTRGTVRLAGDPGGAVGQRNDRRALGDQEQRATTKNEAEPFRARPRPHRARGPAGQPLLPGRLGTDPLSQPGAFDSPFSAARTARKAESSPRWK